MADTSQQALADIQNFNATAQNPNDVLNAAQSKYGTDQSRQRLVGLRSAIMGTEGALNAVDPSVTGRTSNSLVTEAQRSRMVANERAPIAEQYSQQQGALSNENANLSDLSSRAAQEAQMTLTGQDTKRNSLQALYDTLYKREQDAAAAKQAADNAAAQRAQDAQYAALLNALRNGGGNGGGGGAADNRPGLGSFDNVSANINMKDKGVAKYQMNGVWYDNFGDPVSNANAAAQKNQAKSNNMSNLTKAAALANPVTGVPYSTYLAGKALIPKATSGIKSLLGKFF